MSRSNVTDFREEENNSGEMKSNIIDLFHKCAKDENSSLDDMKDNVKLDSHKTADLAENLSSILRENSFGPRNPIYDPVPEVEEVKEELFYCRHCSYSDVSITKLKGHMLNQHPAKAAVILNNLIEESQNVTDVTFFCVRETCAHFTSICYIYEDHIMRCCSPHTCLTGKEKQRLEASVKFLLVFHRNYGFRVVTGFLDFVSKNFKAFVSTSAFEKHQLSKETWPEQTKEERKLLHDTTSEVSQRVSPTCDNYERNKLEERTSLLHDTTSEEISPRNSSTCDNYDRQFHSEPYESNECSSDQLHDAASLQSQVCYDGEDNTYFITQNKDISVSLTSNAIDNEMGISDEGQELSYASSIPNFIDNEVEILDEGPESFSSKPHLASPSPSSSVCNNYQSSTNPHSTGMDTRSPFNLISTFQFPNDQLNCQKLVSVYSSRPIEPTNSVGNMRPFCINILKNKGRHLTLITRTSESEKKSSPQDMNVAQEKDCSIVKEQTSPIANASKGNKVLSTGSSLFPSRPINEVEKAVWPKRKDNFRACQPRQVLLSPCYGLNNIPIAPRHSMTPVSSFIPQVSSTCSMNNNSTVDQKGIQMAQSCPGIQKKLLFILSPINDNGLLRPVEQVKNSPGTVDLGSSFQAAQNSTDSYAHPASSKNNLTTTQSSSCGGIQKESVPEKGDISKGSEKKAAFKICQDRSTSKERRKKGITEVGQNRDISQESENKATTEIDKNRDIPQESENKATTEIDKNRDIPQESENKATTEIDKNRDHISQESENKATTEIDKNRDHISQESENKATPEVSQNRDISQESENKATLEVCKTRRITKRGHNKSMSESQTDKSGLLQDLKSMLASESERTDNNSLAIPKPIFCNTINSVAKKQRLLRFLEYKRLRLETLAECSSVESKVLREDELTAESPEEYNYGEDDGIKDFLTCHLCLYAFSTQYILIRHMEQKHHLRFKQIQQHVFPFLKRESNTYIANISCCKMLKNEKYMCSSEDDEDKDRESNPGPRALHRKCVLPPENSGSDIIDSNADTDTNTNEMCMETDVSENPVEDGEVDKASRTSEQTHGKDGKEIPLKCKRDDEHFRDSTPRDGHREKLPDTVHDDLTQRSKGKRVAATRHPFVYICTVCWRMYSTLLLFNSHVLRLHTGDVFTQIFSGSDFYEQFQRSTKFVAFLRKHDGEKPFQFQCPLCSKGFLFRNGLVHHLRKHAGNKSLDIQKRTPPTQETRRFQCSECDKAFVNSHILNVHMRTHTGEKPYQCVECGKGFSQKGNLQSHERMHTGEKPFKCAHCGTAFTQHLSLQYHERTHTGERPYICQVCHKGFIQKASLTIHMRNHNGTKPFKCQDCGKGFTVKASLKSHMRTHSGEKPFSCSQCGQRFSQRASLRCHMQRHTGEKPFSCDECGRKFSQRNSLKAHMKTHTGEKPFLCSECGKIFSQIMRFRSHMKTHAVGEKPFSCDECGKKFRLKAGLKIHLMTHSGEKPFSCSPRERGFSQRRSLQSDVKTHTGEKPFCCDECGQQFSQRAGLRNHTRKHSGKRF